VVVKEGPGNDDFIVEAYAESTGTPFYL